MTGATWPGRYWGPRIGRAAAESMRLKSGQVVFIDPIYANKRPPLPSALHYCPLRRLFCGTVPIVCPFIFFVAPVKEVQFPATPRPWICVSAEGIQALNRTHRLSVWTAREELDSGPGYAHGHLCSEPEGGVPCAFHRHFDALLTPLGSY